LFITYTLTMQRVLFSSARNAHLLAVTGITAIGGPSSCKKVALNVAYFSTRAVRPSAKRVNTSAAVLGNERKPQRSVDVQPIYQGEKVNGKYHGPGTLLMPDGSKYVGEFSAGQRHGRGTLTTADGVTMSGEWLEDKLNGQGKIVRSCGTIREGTFKDGLLHGTGKVAERTGLTYEGEWEQGEMGKRGKVTYPAGHVYEGDITVTKFGTIRRHGQGKQTEKNGLVYEGGWLFCKYSREGRLWDQDGGYMQGQFKQGRLWVGGAYKFKVGKGKFTGSFVHGVKQGKGRCGVL
jgi:hypothetical protein